MFQLIISLLINLIATLVQIIMLPFNTLITAALPDVSVKIIEVASGIPTILSNLNWSLGLIPPGLVPVFLFILTCEIAKHTIFTSTHVLLKVWNILQKIKFW